jgi:uncharacterized membrane protein
MASMLGLGTGLLKAAPAATPAPLRVLVARGLWHAQYRLDEALALAGAGPVEDIWVWDGTGSGWLSPGDQGGGGLTDFPDAAGLSRYDVVVVANINAKSFGKNADILAAYVRNGGALFLLGGRFAFGKQYQESVLAGVAPVAFSGGKLWGSDLTAVAAGLELKPGPDRLGSGFDGLGWDRKPLLYWYHDVTPTNGAKVLLTAGSKPVLVAGECGKGRVAVFAGSVMGVPADGQMAFWAWDGWPAIEAAVLRWLGEAPRAAGQATISESTRKSVETALGNSEADRLLDAASLGGDEEVKPDTALDGVLMQEARLCRGPEQAGFLVKTVAAMPADMSPALLEVLLPAVLPFAGPGDEKAARDMIKSGKPFKTALGLALLGSTKAADAAELLGRFYEAGKVQAAAGGAGGDDLMDRTGVAGMKPVLEKDANEIKTAIRSGALIGLGQLGDGAAQAILLKAVAGLRGAGAPRPKEYADILTSDSRIFQQALMSALRCGDESAAEPLVEALMENIYIVARARNEANKPKDRLEKVQAQVGAQLTWQREMYRQLALVPDSVRPVLAKRLAAEKDRRVTPLAFAVFGGRTVLVENSAVLKKSPIPAVAALAR